MPFKLGYTIQLMRVDSTGRPTDNVYTFVGQQIINSENPQPAQITTATQAMQADIQAQLNTGTANDPAFQVQQSQDSSAPLSGSG